MSGALRARTAGRQAIACAAVLTLCLAARAHAEWQQPDPTYRDAQANLRMALRDTLGHGGEIARLDSLAVAHLSLAHFVEARRLFERVLAIDPADLASRAGMGKLALFEDHAARAESLLTGALDGADTAPRDLLAARIRQRDYAGAAALADSLEYTARAEMLHRMADDSTYVLSGDASAKILFRRLTPAPLVLVRLNGQSVLMAVDLGAGDLMLDDFVARQCKVELLSTSGVVPWDGLLVTGRNAMVKRLDLGGVRIENLPAAVLPLRKWGLAVNPDGERVAGVIGSNLLRHFTPVLDFIAGRLELSPAARAPGAPRGTAMIPFEVWGESEMMVYGTIEGGRRMGMIVTTAIPGCGVAAPPEVFEELAVKPGAMSRMIRSPGTGLTGTPWGQLSTSVKVGPIARDRVMGWSGAVASSELWRHGVRRDAALSSEFFKGYRVSIDWAKRELLFERE
ncbi:MAG: aspartyl protease family protein [Candidatus Eiseniibacteriota bacterium]